MILLLGEPGDELGSSQYLAVVHGRKEGLPPRLDVPRELALQDALRALIRAGKIRSAHDCSEGGLAVALAECCMSGAEQIGARVLLGTTARADVALFNETQSRVVVSGAELTVESGGKKHVWPVETLRETWHGSIGKLMAAG